MVRTQASVADHLGIGRWLAIVGGSMGGMQALEWGVMYPDRVGAVVPIATSAAASAQQIGWWSAGRRAIRMDPGGGVASTTTRRPATYSTVWPPPG